MADVKAVCADPAHTFNMQGFLSPQDYDTLQAALNFPAMKYVFQASCDPFHGQLDIS